VIALFKMHIKALYRTAMPVRSMAAGELGVVSQENSALSG